MTQGETAELRSRALARSASRRLADASLPFAPFRSRFTETTSTYLKRQISGGASEPSFFAYIRVAMDEGAMRPSTGCLRSAPSVHFAERRAFPFPQADGEACFPRRIFSNCSL